LTELALTASKADRRAGVVDFWDRSGMVFTRDDGRPMDLVLTVAAGYSWDQLAPFVRSLNRGGFHGDIVMFVDNTDAETLRKLERHGVWCIPCHASPPYGDMCTEDDAKYGELRAVYYRFILYLRFLEKHPEYSRVLLADSRDIFFMGDPFAGLTVEPDSLHVFAEAVTVGECQYNTGWLTRAFRAPEAEAMANEPIYCAGAVIGDVQGAIRMCRHMVEHVDVFRPGVKMRGLDQAALNRLIFRDGIKVTTHEFRDGPVLHVGYLPKHKPANPEPATVIHQYDRNVPLRKRIEKICENW